ncbi:D(2) dopamine receptor A-like [Glandiceps talaboti]
MLALAILYVAVCFSGIPGNLLVLAVYTKKRRRRTSHMFIIGLALIDFFVCLVIMPYGIFAELYPEILVQALCKLFSWLWHGSVAGSMIITVAIAVDRYISVCKPHFLMNPTYARLIVLSAIAVSLIFCIPAIFFFGVINTKTDLYDDTQNATLTIVTAECTAVDVKRYASFHIFSNITSVCLLILSVILYISVYITLRKRSQARKINGIGVLHSESGQRGRLASVNLAENVRRVRKTAWPKTEPNIEIVATTVTTQSQLRCNNEDIIENLDNIQPSTSTSSPRQPGLITNELITTCNEQNTTQSSIPKKRNFLQEAGNKTAKMLLLVTITYIVTWIPYWIFVFIPLEFWQTVTPWVKEFCMFWKYFYVINNAINPIIYSFVNRQFRQDSFVFFHQLCQRN